MRLKGVEFTSTNDKMRHVRALGGYIPSVFVGQLVGHSARGQQAEVASLEVDRQAKQVLVRLVCATPGSPEKGKPWRRMTTDETVRSYQEADVVGLAYDERAVFYYDDEPGQQKGK